MEIIGVLLFIVFMFLGSLHYYWAFGGEKWLENALLTNQEGDILFKPDRKLIFLAATFFMLLGLFYITIINERYNIFPEWVYSYFRWIIPVVFFIRAVGDFKYVGFFKKIYDTPFARADLHFYTPLYFIISVLGVQEALIVQ